MHSSLLCIAWLHSFSWAIRYSESFFLSLVVGVVLVAEGIIEIVFFFVLRRQRHAFWILIDGIVTLALGIVACACWPPVAPEISPYLVGISFISSGISRLVLAFAIEVVEPTNTPTN